MIFPPGLQSLSIENLQKLGRFLLEAGFTIHGKYNIAGVASGRNQRILHYFPLDIPGCIPVSASIDTSDCEPKNITQLSIAGIAPDGFKISSNITEMGIPHAIAGNVALQY